MNSYGSCSEDHSRGEVGIAAARHVYGPASVHLLPCKIHHTGSAPVATYFRPRAPVGEESKSPSSAPSEALEEAAENGAVVAAKTGGVENGESVVAADTSGTCGQKWEHFEDDEGEHTARFRGRKLIGRKVTLPEGVSGVVLREQPCPPDIREENEDVTSFWAAETSFRDVTVWGHDEVRRESTVDRCLAWLEVSKSVHDP